MNKRNFYVGMGLGLAVGGAAMFAMRPKKSGVKTFRRCTLCTSRKSDEIRAQIFQEMPQADCAVLP